MTFNVRKFIGIRFTYVTSKTVALVVLNLGISVILLVLIEIVRAIVFCN